MFQKAIDEVRTYHEGRRVQVVANWDGFVDRHYGEVVVDGASWHTTGYADAPEDAIELAWEWARFNDETSAIIEQDNARFGD